MDSDGRRWAGTSRTPRSRDLRHDCTQPRADTSPSPASRAIHACTATGTISGDRRTIPGGCRGLVGGSIWSEHGSRGWKCGGICCGCGRTRSTDGMEPSPRYHAVCFDCRRPRDSSRCIRGCLGRSSRREWCAIRTGSHTHYGEGTKTGARGRSSRSG